MIGGREPSLPPSDPHGLGRSIGDLSPRDDRPRRVLLGAAVVAGLLLLGGGLFLWRRPHATAEAPADEAASSSAMAAELSPPMPQPSGDSSPVAVSDARVLACHDRGPKVTSPEQCDHLPPIEKALSAAIEQAAACVPVGAGGGGTIEYVVDVSFLHNRITVALPHTGRSIRDHKVLRTCAAAVRGAMQLTQLSAIDHQHAQYKITVTATYKSSADGG